MKFRSAGSHRTTPNRTARNRTTRFGAALGAIAVATACSVSSSELAQAQTAPAGKPVEVGLKSLKFRPNKITVKAGTGVNFVWKESVAHNVVFANKGPKSKSMNKGFWLLDTKPLKPGNYKFKCTLHPGMDGQLTVK